MSHRLKPIGDLGERIMQDIGVYDALRMLSDLIKEIRKALKA